MYTLTSAASHLESTQGQSEPAIGRWLAARGNRDRVVLSTKCGARPTVPGDRTLDSAEGLSAAAIGQAAEGSLRRLGTDHIDVYWAHIEDRSVPLEETLGAFAELAGAGKVREIGASNKGTGRSRRGWVSSAADGRRGSGGPGVCTRRSARGPRRAGSGRRA
ncbi:aldo/keto reductase [Streptosporangium album]|uniref:aldo/keto reductase n=1 Tax=Streptosporangium album TaxID=47479 RepID=UPI0028A6D9DF|nr:aldo/keto reductase [Streptosporangium album]